MNVKTPWAIWARMAPVAALAFAMGCGARAGYVGEPSPAAEPEPAPALSVAAGIDLDTIRAGEFDNGKMWTFEYPPLEYFRETYHFQPNESWFERVRLGALRIQGCSASFVSPNGLVLTNHHCARGSVAQVSQPGESLLDNGFYATSLDEERESSQTADQLIAIRDVTEEVHAAIEGRPEAEQADALNEIREDLSEHIAQEYGGDEAGILVQVIELWDGAKYSAYVFRHYTNLRLVASPELQIGHFGGDPDNFTYPRYDLDFSFYRIYDEDGNPLKTEHWFKWSDEGVEEGDAVFVIGNPGGSSRLQTVAQLELRGAVQDKAIYELLDSRADALQAFYDEDPERGEAMNLRNQIFGLLNSEKAYRGMWEGLQNPVYMARRRDSERQFREAIESDSALNAEYGGLLERMAEIQKQRMAYAADFGAFIAFGSPNFDAAALRRAFFAYRYVTASESGAPREVLDNLKGRVLAISDQSPSLQRRLLTARLRDFERHLGSDSEISRMILQGRTPDATADAILATSALADSAQAASALEAGTLTAGDPVIRVIAAISDRLNAYQTAFQRLQQQEAAVARTLGRARFDIYSTSIPPDATFSLRIADGVVKGYDYNGTYAPVYTTLYGLYDHYYSYGPGTDWDLPARWLSPPESLDLATPVNFVLTADVIGGNSGSPVINTDLEVVGLIFDGNIESLPGDYIYDPEVNRAVAVDVRGILEALDDMYDADRLVLELTTGQLVPSEEEADAVLAGK
jgi:hypothetical protein